MPVKQLLCAAAEHIDELEAQVAELETTLYQRDRLIKLLVMRSIGVTTKWAHIHTLKTTMVAEFDHADMLTADSYDLVIKSVSGGIEIRAVKKEN